MKCPKVKHGKHHNACRARLSRSSHLEYTGSIRCPPGIEEVIFARRHKPLSTVCKLKRQHTALMKM